MRSGKQPQEQILEIWEKFYSALYVNVRLIYYATYLVNLLDLLSRRNPPRRLFCRRQRQPSRGSDYCWPLCYRDVAAVAAAADMTEGVSPPPTITFLYCVCYVRWREGGRGGHAPPFVICQCPKPTLHLWGPSSCQQGHIYIRHPHNAYVFCSIENRNEYVQWRLVKIHNSHN